MRTATPIPANSQKQQLALGLLARVGPGVTAVRATSSPWQAAAVAQQAVVAPAVAGSPAASATTAPEVKATQSGGANMFDTRVKEDGGSAPTVPAPGGGTDFLVIFSSSYGAPRQTSVGGVRTSNRRGTHKHPARSPVAVSIFSGEDWAA